jgi:transposase-like protein
MAKPKVGPADVERRRSIVERWRRSGQSAPSFARRHGMSQWTLYSWARQSGEGSERRRSQRGNERVSGGRGERERRVASTPPRATIDLVPVRLLSEQSSGDLRPGRAAGDGVLEIHFRSGDVVRVLGDVPGERVSAVVSAVRQAC